MKRSEGIHYLTHDPYSGEDTGHLQVPCSRYGRNGYECAAVAWRLAYLYARETHGEEITTDELDSAMSLVVNDHDDVAYIIRNYGHRKYR